MSSTPLRPAVFFDRDGTLIEDRGYFKSLSDVIFYPDVFSALKRIKDRYLLFIITNQTGIGLGYLSHEDVEKVNHHIVKIFNEAGVPISAVYFCPHTRDQNCLCIKPKPYFLLKAAQEFHLDLSRSFVIGDHPHDMEFARSVGARGIYLLTGHGEKHSHELIQEVRMANNMEGAIKLIFEESSQFPNGIENDRLKIESH